MADFKISKFEPTAYNLKSSHRKEDNFSKSYTFVTFDRMAKNDRDRFKTSIDIRLYWTKSGTCYACIWINNFGVYASGSAVAGGWGYHKESHAIEHAFISMGIYFTQSWGGSGDSAIERAMWQVAKRLSPKVNVKNSYIHCAHG